jgi:predicted ribosome quality control (RQC) complex YloA/Tae2 family protein
MNGIYLSFLVKEIQEKLTNLFINEVKTYERIVQLVFKRYALYISLFPEMLGMYLAKKSMDKFIRHPRFTRELRSRRIKSITQLATAPVLHLELEKSMTEPSVPFQIIISLYRDAPNLSVRKGRMQFHLHDRFVQRSMKKSIVSMTDEECAVLFNKSDKERIEEMIHNYDGVDKTCAAELTCARIQELKAYMSGAQARPRLVSIKPFKISLFAESSIKQYRDFNTLFKDAVTLYIEEYEQIQLDAFRRQEKRKLKRRVSILEKRLLTDEHIEEFRIKGEMILSSLQSIKKGNASVILVNPYTDKKKKIELDPKKTPQQNAEFYFARYKKIKRGQPNIRARIQELRNHIESIETLTHTDKTQPAKAKKNRQKRSPFRIFHLQSGSTVYVGKNARSNEQLTFGFAQAHDYFFHVRGYEGSHVIMRSCAPRNQRPSTRDIRSAAGVAAYFSKARSQKNIAVSYTQRKYLKKPKKGKVGSVQLMREQVLFVDPVLPVIQS